MALIPVFYTIATHTPITNKDESFLVEVKNFRFKKLKKNDLPTFRIRKKDFIAYSNYAGLLNLELKYAIYWQNMRAWTLVDSNFFVEDKNYFTIVFGQAIMRNDMIMVGDYVIATVSPLSIRIDFFPASYDLKKKRQLVNVKIRKIRILTKNIEIKDNEMRRLALILMIYAGWNISESQIKSEESRIHGVEFMASPEVDEDYGHGRI